MFTFEQLKEMGFNYDPFTGRVTKRKETVTYINDGQRITIKIKGKSYQLSSIVWTLTTGKLPDSAVEQINGDIYDFRRNNLRLSDHKQLSKLRLPSYKRSL